MWEALGCQEKEVLYWRFWVGKSHINGTASATMAPFASKGAVAQSVQVPFELGYAISNAKNRMLVGHTVIRQKADKIIFLIVGSGRPLGHWKPGGSGLMCSIRASIRKIGSFVPIRAEQ